ncbi:MAG: signal peptidase II [Candidatus Omnitrophica bacterium]|nr:signal peptidase II [Candidatus Omnitrophota bacterium]
MIRFFALVVLILSSDQFLKIIILQRLAEKESVPVITNIFHLTLVHNTGVAFGFFRDSEALLRVLISLSLVVLLYWGIRLRKTVYGGSFALILGGALGNWVDRLRYGAVIDYLDFRFWPVFNLADSAITLGVVLYLWNYLKSSRT